MTADVHGSALSKDLGRPDDLGRPVPTAPATAQGATAPDAAHAPRPANRAWLRRYVAVLVMLDAVAAVLATRAVAGWADISPRPRVLLATLAVAAVVWVAAAWAADAYEQRRLTVGADEYRALLRAGVWLLSGVALVGLFSGADVLAVRLATLAVVPTATLTIVERYAVRRWLRRRRARGELLHRTIAVGAPDEVHTVTQRLSRATYAGLQVVGACVPGTSASIAVAGTPIPRLGGLDDVPAAVDRAGADTVVVAGQGVLSQQELRRLAWSLQDHDVDLVVAPGMTDVAGPRVAVRPVEGLPLLHIEQPQLRGAARVLSDGLDRALAALALLLLLPLLVVLGAAIVAESPGSPLFRQERIGRDGRRFAMWKLRTMRPGADRELEWLLDLNEHDGPLFKIRDDPRVTRLGRWLRRLSLDELPQLFNVVRGDMAIVGPRPPLPEEVERFDADVHRRFLVKPGITGLWQVNGRADLPWDEAVRLDLYYVDNWSPALDATIVWKTLGALTRRAGAY